MEMATMLMPGTDRWHRCWRKAAEDGGYAGDADRMSRDGWQYMGPTQDGAGHCFRLRAGCGRARAPHNLYITVGDNRL